MKKFLYNINQASKIITFVVAMLSSLFVIGVLLLHFHIFSKKVGAVIGALGVLFIMGAFYGFYHNCSNSDYWKWKD